MGSKEEHEIKKMYKDKGILRLNTSIYDYDTIIETTKEYANEKTKQQREVIENLKKTIEEIYAEGMSGIAYVGMNNSLERESQARENLNKKFREAKSLLKEIK